STTQGSQLALQESGAIFVEFSGPPKDTFIITAKLPFDNVTAVRLEALTHNSLPKKGPGRASNGNFVLSEFEVLQKPAGGKKFAPVKLHHAVADHSQEDFPVVNAIDGNKEKS